MNTKTLLLLLFLAGSGVAAQAQSEGLVIYRPQFDGQVIVAGAAPIQPAPIVYTQPVVYDAPVIYNAPVAHNAPVVYNAPVYGPPVADAVYNPPVINNAPACDTPAQCPPAGCAAPCQTSTVQVIHFGRGQAASQGYYFNAPR